MRRLILTTGLFGVIVLLLTACEKDEQATFDKPLVIAPEKISVPLNATDLSAIFRVSVDSRLNASYSATGSGVSVTNPSGNIGADSIVIKYNTGSATGSASIILTVTDSENQTASSTYVLNVGQAVQQVKVTENITADTKWSADTVYILGGRITVVDGASLTIEAGTIIKGEAGTGANATALLIAQGGKLFAEGTAEKPVVFTSIADELTPDDIHSGNVASPNLDPDINGLWGGVIILGKAPISASNESGDVSIIQIEGIPTSDQNGLYGGNIPNDNSGNIQYVSIRHGGTNIGSGNEINGLTLGGVGSETVIENIEIVSNQDDGIEWFGGTVNVTNAFVWNVGDDAIDTDQAWSGTLDNFVIIAPGDHNFELDGPEGSNEAGHIIQNGTIIANDPENGRFSSDLINTDDNSIVQLKNLYFTAIAEGQMINRTEFVTGEVSFENIELNIPQTNLSDHINGEVPQGVSAVDEPTVGADMSVFEWTWAAKAGKLAGL